MAFETYQRLRYVADADTPANLMTYVGTVILVPVDEPIPTVYTNPGPGGIAGYGRAGSDGVQEWVMAGAQDELLRHVSRMPPEGSWTDFEARRVWRKGFDDIRGGLNSTNDLKLLATAMYAAVRADMVAKGWAAP